MHLAISTACSSGFKALASAIRLIDRGLADAVVVGSADSLCRTTVFGFHSLGLTAPTATQPFSRDRAGLTLGEGSAYVVIERDGKPRSARRSPRSAAPARPRTRFITRARTPRASAVRCACAKRSIARSLSPNEISYVSAHGTGTPLNDATEAFAVNRVFERPIPLTATKSLTGHTLGTAGLTSVVLAIESLRRQADSADAARRPDRRSARTCASSTTLTPARVEHVLVNAFGFGGSNASAVISRRA